MATLYENYITGADWHSAAYGANQWRAQTFTVGYLDTPAHQITSVKLYLAALQSPGIVTVSIKAVDGSGHPIGADLCSGTTNGNTLTVYSTFGWREITLGAGCNLAANTKYAIVVKALSGDSDNAVMWKSDRTSPTYEEGNGEYTEDAGVSWTAFSTWDFLFEEWGIRTGPGGGVGVVFPSDDVARVSSIRHIFRPGFFRMQVGLGDLGFDVDIAESTVRKVLDTAKEAGEAPSTAGVGYPEILEVLGMTSEEFAKMGLEIAARRRVSTDFSIYEEQIAYEEWFQEEMRKLREMQE